MKKTLLFACLLITAVTAMAQSRDKTLTIKVSLNTNESLKGQEVDLTQVDYSLSYGSLTLNAAGVCTVKVYAGNHHVEVVRPGYETAAKDFFVPEEATDYEVDLTLVEKVRTPFALMAQLSHDAYTGDNHVLLSWNTEQPAFFDDFESYDAFATQFGEWTGIDADHEAAAALVGNYPNRGTLQYAQIINPLAVDPTWWYDYPILRPYDGKQYVGFTRTSSGNANDDWLITPAIEVGNDNMLMFLGKAADQFTERFQVYVTTKLDNPVQTDFTRLDQGNFETADYTGWRLYEYDLAEYAGQTVKLAIRYISNYNLYRSFMLMIDNFYVGQSRGYETAKAKARRIRRSEDNPNEMFKIYRDGVEVDVTSEYSYELPNEEPGTHEYGVKAVYRAAESDMVTTSLTIPATGFSKVTFVVEAQSKLGTDGVKLNLVNTQTSDSYELTVADGQAVIPSLPDGEYMVNVEEGAFAGYQQSFSVSGDRTVNITLSDNMLTPYNITADIDGQTVVVKWNQELLYTDSFEDYPDFATGSFGEWKTYDLDQMPVYTIGLGSSTNIVSFPGSGTPTVPTAVAPMVFNPWNTVPAMLPTDAAVQAPTGEKTVIFFSPQRYQADKWLISPEVEIRDGYAVSLTMKSYDGMYAESVEFCVSTDGDQPADFTPVSTAQNIPAGEWTIYQTPLSAYVGQKVRIGIHYISFDTFFLQIDDFTVGPESGDAPVIDYGNVVRYDIYLDGVKVGESTTPNYTFTDMAMGQHTIGIVAVYQNGSSEMAEYVVDVTTGIATVMLDSAVDASSEVYSLSGQRMETRWGSLPKGIYLVKKNNENIKVQKK